MEELEARQYRIVLTARSCFQVPQLVRRHRLNCRLIGRHFGKNTFCKLLGLGIRAAQLIPAIAAARPQLAVSHGSRAQLVAATCLGIPSLCIGDYEFARTSALVHPKYLMFPDVVPHSALPTARRVLRYPGIKEDVYVPRFVPDPLIREQLGLGSEDIVAVMRPPACEAHYHVPLSDHLFAAAVEVLSQDPRVKLVVLPRNEKQAMEVRERWAHLVRDHRLRIPSEVVDGLNLIWHADLVVSGGGTMNREAAALNVPVYSTFGGSIGAVDRYLNREGRLVILNRVEDVRTKIAITRRVTTGRPPGTRRALDSIVHHITTLVEQP
jgi:predicted glycosyltransferase